MAGYAIAGNAAVIKCPGEFPTGGVVAALAIILGDVGSAGTGHGGPGSLHHCTWLMAGNTGCNRYIAVIKYRGRPGGETRMTVLTTGYVHDVAVHNIRGHFTLGVYAVVARAAIVGNAFVVKPAGCPGSGAVTGFAVIPRRWVVNRLASRNASIMATNTRTNHG